MPERSEGLVLVRKHADDIISSFTYYVMSAQHTYRREAGDISLNDFVVVASRA